MSSHPDKEGKGTSSTPDLTMTADEAIEQLRLEMARREAKDQEDSPTETVEIAGIIGKNEARAFVRWIFSPEAQELALRAKAAQSKQEPQE